MPGHDALQFVPTDYGEPLPEAFVDATQEVLGTLGRLDLTLASATTVRALAGAGADEAGMGVGGALRWIDANVDVAMAGGAGAGRYDVYVTAGATTIAPGAPPVDTTDYSWALAIVAGGGAAPATAYAKKVGYLDWDGAAITRLVQTFGRRDDAPLHAVSPVVGVSAVEAIMPGGATAKPIRAVVGGAEVFAVSPTGLITSAVGQSFTNLSLTQNAIGALALTGAAAGLTIGGDTNLYRSAADVLRTDDNLWAGFNVAAQVGAAGQTTIGGVGPGSAAGVTMNDVTWYRAAAAVIATAAGVRVGANLALTTDAGSILFGAAGDANLYRTAAGALRSDGSLTAGSDLIARPGANQVLVGNAGAAGAPGISMSGDTNLYRTGAGALKTDGTFAVGGAATVGGYVTASASGGLLARTQANVGSTFLATRAAADANDRFSMDASGSMLWGPGNAGFDATLYRSAAGILRTDTNLYVNLLTSSGGFRATSANVGATGSGLEVTFATGTSTGQLRAYDRTGGAFLPLDMLGSTVKLWGGTPGATAKLTVDGTGVSFWGVPTAARPAAIAMNNAPARPAAFDYNAYTMNQLAAVVMAMYNDLKNYGLEQ